MPYQNTLKDNITQCLVCPRNCRLANYQRGFCFVRQNIDGEITLTAYGKTTGLAIDPVEKKPLYHFYPGSKVLSFGTLGCNMGCCFCQNWHITKTKDHTGLIQEASPKEIALSAKQYGCKSVAFTYNDPVIFLEYAIDTAIECHALGIKTIAVTAGYINPEPRVDLFNHIDAANIDLKGFSKEFYKKMCLADIEPVLETIKYVKNETPCHLELTTLLIEGFNDSNKDLRAQCDWIVENLGTDVPLHFSAFFPSWKLKNVHPTNPKTLLKAYQIAKKAGIKYVYTGNICDDKTSTTFCHRCKKPLIKRHGFEIKEYNLTEKNSCRFCGAICGGIFE
ncbi:MAG: AmmeMemoRadiSam system radical SAM enzyme [Candidatus Gastranaerophilales bacterium]|nr:AmmeMemoRadiSam system radical SAM enzyme [Candidatus Gastranaerophilales bacterium]